MSGSTALLLPALLLGALLIAWLPLLPRARTWARVLVLGGAAFFILRYVVWRTLETLPPPAPSPQALWQWTFYLLETASLLGLLIGCVIQMRTADRRAEADAGAAAVQARAAPPFVDVFIATYNEGFDVVERTIVGALALDYPRYAVWVLDDGKRDWLRDYCKSKGARYVTRPDNRHAKAGNLNHGLAVSAAVTRGELVMVLDADFVPRRDFLRRTVGLFDDPRIGLVQTPQHFFNPDPIQSNLGAQRCWVDEQRYFFDVVQPSRDAWDVAFCCGTSSVVRRELLTAIGAFPVDSVTEDVLLSYLLMQRGYVTRYLNEALSLGLAPEGMKEYLTQRARWCLGTLQILRLRTCPLWAPGHTLLERVSFLWLVMSWLVTFPWTLATLVAPLLYLYFGIYAISADWHELVGYFAPAFVAMIFSISWISNRTFAVAITDVTRLVMLFPILRSIAQGLLRPRGQRFKVTAKGGDRSRAVVQWGVMKPFLALLTLNAAGIALNLLPGYAVVDDFDQQGMNIFWSIYNMLLMLLTALVCIDLPRRRREERFDVDEAARIHSGGDSAPCVIRDLSMSGARVRLDVPVAAGDLRLDVAGVGPLACELSRGIAPHEVALRFVEPGPGRDALIRKLYTGGFTNAPREAAPGRLFIAVLRRAFGREPD